MKTETFYCLRCKNQVASVGRAELMSEKSTFSASEVDSISVVSDLFNFHVCPTCGLTTMHATQRMKTIAEELIEDRGGHG